MMLDVMFRVDSQLLADYFSYLFPVSGDGLRKVSTSSGMGKLLVAHCRPSDSPVPEPAGGTVFKIELPNDTATKPLIDRFLYYPPASLSALNKALSAFFDLDFTAYYLKGERMGIQKKDVVSAFIVSRGLFTVDCYDALHKRAYRHSCQTYEAIQRRLLRKAYYIDETIDTKGLTP